LDMYRPVSILPAMSKIYERIASDQLADFVLNYISSVPWNFSKRLCVPYNFLLRLLEDWRQALHQNKYVAATLIDLSKAFDCFPHNILAHKNAFPTAYRRHQWAF
jgi:hypothetical protein